MSILVAVLVLSFLIFIHEFGHFLVAKRAGLLVEEFGIGLPPRLWGKKVGETVYSVNWLPIGGFVRIYGESEVPEPPLEVDKSRSFSEQSLGVRLAVLLAGVTMNFIFGVALLSVIFSLGVPSVVSDRLLASGELSNVHVELIDVVKDSPAGAAGFKLGDKILAVAAGEAEESISDVSAFRQFIAANAGKEVTITAIRNGSELSVSVVPRVNPPAGQGALGVALAQVGTLRYPWYKSIWQAIQTAVEIAGNVVAGLYFLLRDLIIKGTIGLTVAGPIGILQIAGEAVRLGGIRLANFTAVLTINLAVLNVLPIPALDGGRLVFLGLEKLRGKAISRKVESMTHSIGMALLFVLIILLTIYDIKRL